MPPGERAPRPPGGRTLLLVGLLTIGLNLRPALTSLSPLLETIRADLGLDHAALGLLTVVPVLCMGVLPAATVRLAARIGEERGLLLGVALVAVGIAPRAGGRDAPLLFGTALLAGAGIAVAQALAPVVIKRHFADRATLTLVTGLYSAAMTVGAGTAAGLAVPLAHRLGSWPLSLAAWSLPALLAAAVWLPVARRRRDVLQGGAARHGSRLPWRSGTAWLITVFSGATFALFWSVLTWLAPALRDRGVSEEGAGLLLALMTVVQVVSSLAISVLACRSPDRRPWLALCLVVGGVGFAGVALFPSAAPTWFWTALIGFGIGAIFPLALGLPLDFAEDAASVGRLAAMALSVGYLLATLGLFLTGWLRAVSGGYAAPFLALAFLYCAMLPVTLRLRPPPRTPGGAAIVPRPPA